MTEHNNNNKAIKTSLAHQREEGKKEEIGSHIGLFMGQIICSGSKVHSKFRKIWIKISCSKNGPGQ